MKMNIHFLQELLLALLIVSTVHCVSKNDFDSAVAATARKCQITFKACREQIASLNEYYKTNEFCKMFLIGYIDDVDPFDCMVSNGLCTSDEFDELIGVACDGNFKTDFSDSEYENYFYHAIDSTSAGCQDQVLFCINISVVATVLKQEEKFCALFDLDINGINSRTCLTQAGHCSVAEFLLLKTAACDFNEKTETQGVSDTLLITSQSCQSAIENCTVLNQTAFSSIRNKEYCEPMASNTAMSCLVGSDKCSDFEFQLLNNEACENRDAFSKLSSMCIHTVETCAAISPLAQYLFKIEEYCDLFEMNFNGVSAYQCLVEIGLCTDSEYYALRLAMCDDPGSQFILDNALLYVLLRFASKPCQNNVVDCIFKSIIATLLKADNQYCQLMTFSTNNKNANTCLQNCSSTELDYFRRASCDTSLAQLQPSAFTKAVMSTSQPCKNQIENCAFGSNLAFASIQGGQYCKIMNKYQAGAETYACLVGSGGCTDNEYQIMEDAACDNE
ncbi:uncharacterized protein LOC129927280 isoform X2 [Biomphalaria glabrata]|nr:uncharacterized protein LOC129927280 isoform X2 [Biomphalaria glabrata]XP_055891628.1 uncharacterized protein LOC129927280 isoform X2 [Biomphalaria glabrata]XP_055891629.1 uncharacterized protein LOC129927280 isoform X2 [Biomphalaria glabrata]